jgi:hypothetical protein
VAQPFAWKEELSMSAREAFLRGSVRLGSTRSPHQQNAIFLNSKPFFDTLLF